MAVKNSVEPEITLASTTETQEELDHAVGPNWREPFDPDKAKAEREEKEKKDAEAAKAGKTPDGSAPPDKRSHEGENEDEELPKGVQKRIDKYAGRAKAAEAEVKALKERLDALEAKSGPKTIPKEDLEPQKKDFKDPDEWIKAHGKWAAREALREQAVKAEETAVDAHTRKVFDSHLERVNKFREEHDDFDEVVDANTTTFSEAVAIAIVEADNGPAITYHLATHPEELEKISQMSRARQVMEIGKLSASLSPSGSNGTPTTTVKSKTPAPITPVRTTKAVASSTKLEDASTDDFIKMRNQQERDARRRR